MKKHITVTLIILIIFSVILGGFLYWRSQSLGLDGQTQPVGTAEAEDEGEQTGKESETSSSDEAEETEPASGTMATEIETEMETEQTTGAVRMIFTGDVLFANSFVNSYGSGGIGAVIEEQLLTQLVQSDITMVNQEFPFSNRGTQMPDKQYTFRADPSYVTALGEMGVDIVSLANNHVLDYGREALSDTFVALDEAGILYAGAGESAQRARELQLIEVSGQKIGFLAASRVIPVTDWNVDNATPGVFTTYDGTALCTEVAAAEELCDFVVVFVHWGVEYDEYPQEYQRSLAKSYIDAGADLVIGGHTHCLQGIEYYQGKPIYYSLGNFVFGASIDQSMLVEVTLDAQGQPECSLIPIYAKEGCTRLMDDDGASDLYKYIEEISTGITVTETGIVVPE